MYIYHLLNETCDRLLHTAKIEWALFLQNTS